MLQQDEHIKNKSPASSVVLKNSAKLFSCGKCCQIITEYFLGGMNFSFNISRSFSLPECILRTWQPSDMIRRVRGPKHVLRFSFCFSAVSQSSYSIKPDNTHPSWHGLISGPVVIEVVVTDDMLFRLNVSVYLYLWLIQCSTWPVTSWGTSTFKLFVWMSVWPEY